MRQLLFQITLLSGLTVAATPAAAHDFWVAPDPYRLDAPGTVALSLKEGVDMKGDTLPYIPHWFQDFSQVDSTDRSAVASLMGNDPAATITAAGGLTLIGYHSNRIGDEFESEKFLTYLQEEALDDVIADREARGEADKVARESFVRCAKSLVQTGPVADTDIHLTKLGYTLELIPQTNPYTLSPGDSLQIQLLYQDAPLEGRRVRAFTRQQPDVTVDVLTDSNGMATLTLPSAGEWLIKSVHLVRFEEFPPIEWESYWASLTFEMR